MDPFALAVKKEKRMESLSEVKGAWRSRPVMLKNQTRGSDARSRALAYLDDLADPEQDGILLIRGT